MELVKNIFFNTDRLTANSTVKISYTGKFFQDGSKEVSIRYGFGNEWENQTEADMVKTDLGFQIEVELISSDLFNFCFYNENGEWDNNEGNNYVFQIEKKPVELIVLEDSSLNNNIAEGIEELLDNSILSFFILTILLFNNSSFI